ncbi:MAG: hypothetical protein K0S57_80 [Ramlibacter sp.]|jgi:hypothetical protein|nr:hypothetical protein [Ramlibacter sp.]
MANGWTPERRERQAELIRQWQPWAVSTGPQTEEGKAASSKNAYKGGNWLKQRQFRRELYKALKRQAVFVSDVCGGKWTPELAASSALALLDLEDRAVCIRFVPARR